MSLSTLPDLCLLTILDRIPLYDLLATVNRICHRWASLRPIACHQRKHPLFLVQRKNDLHYLLGKTPYLCHINDMLQEITNDDGITPYYRPNLKHHFEYHSLVVLNLSGQTCTELGQLLPNITSLYIGQFVSRLSSLIESINILLEFWSNKLVNLNLHISYQYIANFYNQNPLDSLFKQMNLLSNLKRFKLRLTHPSYVIHDVHDDIKHNLKTKFKFLLHLEQFDYVDDKNAIGQHIIDNIEDALKDASNCELKSLFLGPGLSFGSILHYSPALAARLTQCWHPYYRRSELDQFRNASLRMSSLQILSLRSPDNISYVEFIQNLSHLKQLILLELKYIPESFIPVTKIILLQQISSIKAVDLAFYTFFSHDHLENLSLPNTFPNVQVIQLSHLSGKCDQCVYDLADLGPELYDQPLIKQCNRRILKPLKQCTKLHKIYSLSQDVRNLVIFEQVLTRDQL